MIEDMIEVDILEDNNFLKIKETLTRIGISSRKEKKLYQSCHILHKKDKFYISHFKSLFALDGKPSDLSDDDLGRLNTIAVLLEDWGLLKILDKDKVIEPRIGLNKIKILPFKEKDEWELVAKFQLGKTNKYRH